MPKDPNKPDAEKEPAALPHPSSQDLRGRQSVRATFKLTSEAIEVMSAVSAHLGIKQKSLFDHLIDDVAALETIARDVKAEQFDLLQRMQKTFVLSRRTLNCLDRASKNLETSRDALVEYSIQRLMPVIAKEKEKHRLRKRALKQVNDYQRLGEDILNEVKASLGEEDPLYVEFKRAIATLDNAHNIIRAFIEKGRIIERF